MLPDGHLQVLSNGQTNRQRASSVSRVDDGQWHVLSWQLSETPVSVGIDNFQYELPVSYGDWYQQESVRLYMGAALLSTAGECSCTIAGVWGREGGNLGEKLGKWDGWE